MLAVKEVINEKEKEIKYIFISQTWPRYHMKGKTVDVILRSGYKTKLCLHCFRNNRN